MLANLFPAYCDGSKRKFYPYSESAVAKQHHRKKVVFKGKGKSSRKSVLAMIVEGKALSILRGVKKERLKDNGISKTIEFLMLYK